MIKILIIQTLFILPLINIQSQGIEFFEGSWEEALQLAEEEEKLIFVDCYAEWCGPCKRMAAQVFPDQKVGDFFNANFINLKWDMEKGKGLEFRKKYPVSAFPTLYFIDPNGEVVVNNKGAKDIAGLIALGEKAIENFNPNSHFSDLYEEGDRSKETVYYHFQNLERSGENILPLANDHFGNNPDFNVEYQLKILSISATETDSRLFDYFIQNKESIIRLQGEEFYFKQAEKAGWNTVGKAMDFRESFLLEEAIRKMDLIGLPKLEVFKAKANLYYGAKTRNQSQFLDHFRQFLKLEGSNDVPTAVEFTNLALKLWPKDPEFLNSIEKEVHSLAKKSKDSNLQSIHEKVLEKLNETSHE